MIFLPFRGIGVLEWSNWSCKKSYSSRRGFGWLTQGRRAGREGEKKGVPLVLVGGSVEVNITHWTDWQKNQ